MLRILIVAAATAGCKETFEPPVTGTDIYALVVDGFLNNSSDTTFIRLSHSNPPREGVNHSAEKGAQLSVEDTSEIHLYHE